MLGDENNSKEIAKMMIVFSEFNHQAFQFRDIV